MRLACWSQRAGTRVSSKCVRSCRFRTQRKVLDREDALARVAAGTVTQSLVKPDRAFKLTSDGAIVRAQFHRSHYRSLRGHNGLRLLEEWRQRLRSGIPRDVSRKPIWRAIHRRLRPRDGDRFAANISFYDAEVDYLASQRATMVNRCSILIFSITCAGCN